VIESLGSINAPSPVLYVAALGFVVGSAWVGRRLPAIWRGGPEYERLKSRFAVFGEPWATSSMSAFPIGVPFGLTGGVLSALVVAGQDDVNGLGEALLSLAHMIIPFFMALLVLYLGVLFLARPKFLIPPHLRGHRGALPESVASLSHDFQRWLHWRRRLK